MSEPLTIDWPRLNCSECGEEFWVRPELASAFWVCDKHKGNDELAMKAAHRAFDNAYCAGCTTYQAVEEAIKNYKAYLLSSEYSAVTKDSC